MATSLGFTPTSMNWEASNLPDELANFKQYCNLIFAGPFSKLTVILHSFVDRQIRSGHL